MSVTSSNALFATSVNGEPATIMLDPLGTNPGPLSPTDVSWISGANTGGGIGSIGSPGSAAVGSGFHINLLYDAAAMAAPQSFRDGIQTAMNLLSAAISDNVTVNIKIDYSGTGGGAAAGPDNGLYESYSSVRTALVANASAGDTTFSSLPNTATISGQSTVAVWNAQLKLFGLMSPSDTTTDDGSATFATDIDPGLLVGVALHELTHALGRVPYGSQPDIFDLDRFTSAGTRLFSDASTAPAAYFSLDGGVTKLADYGRSSDPSDFLNGGVQGADDPFNEFYTSNTLQQLTADDLKQLDALGFHLASAASPETDLSASGAALNGTTLSFQIHDSNSASSSANASTTGIYLSSDNIIDNSDILISTISAPALGIGATDTQSASLLDTVVGGNIAPGTYFVGAIANYDSQTPETDYTNNATSAVQLILGDSGNNTLVGTSGNDVIMGGGLPSALVPTFAAWNDWASNVSSADRAVDVNGDHKADLVQFGTNVVSVALSSGSGFGAWTPWTSGITPSDQVVDLNGDGNADLLQLYHGRAIVALSTGSGFGSWQDWTTGTTSSDRAVDVNGDHEADLVQFRSNGVYVALSDGGSFGPWTLWATGITASDQIVDLNGDGNADLLQIWHGRAIAALSTGSGFGAWHDWATGATSTDVAVDINGDHKADLLQFSSGNELMLAQSTGTSFGAWTAARNGITSSDKVIDLNGDGSGDILQFYQGRAIVALSNSLGSGNDILTGGAGADTFVFNSFTGHQEVTDFQPGLDVLQLDRATFVDGGNVLAHTADDGHGNSIISYDLQHTITLDHVSKAALSMSDFRLV